jgi:hypothetical protein
MHGRRVELRYTTRKKPLSINSVATAPNPAAVHSIVRLSVITATEATTMPI